MNQDWESYALGAYLDRTRPNRVRDVYARNEKGVRGTPRGPRDTRFRVAPPVGPVQPFFGNPPTPPNPVRPKGMPTPGPVQPFWPTPPPGVSPPPRT